MPAQQKKIKILCAVSPIDGFVKIVYVHEGAPPK